MKEKIGVAIITCNRFEYFKTCIESVQKCQIDCLVVVNDGKPYENQELLNCHVIQHNINTGVAIAKNDGLKYLIDNECTHLFLIEDDMEILNPEVFNEYVKAAKVSGILHLNYGPGSPFNRKQNIKNFDLHNRHLLSETSEVNPKAYIEYPNNILIALYEHTVGMFTYYHKKVIDVIGYIPTCFDNCWEHVSHTQDAIKHRFHPPFWWFADISHSEQYLAPQKDAINNSSIAEKKDDWMKKVMNGRDIYKQKHGVYPNENKQTDLNEVTKTLKTIKQFNAY